MVLWFLLSHIIVSGIVGGTPLTWQHTFLSAIFEIEMKNN